MATAKERLIVNVEDVEKLMGEIHERVVRWREEADEADWGDVGDAAHIREMLRVALGYED